MTSSDVVSKLTLNKHVSNTNGGTANASAWTLAASGTSGGFSGAGSPAIGADASVGPNNVTGGLQYTLSESGGPATGYTSTGILNCTGGTFPLPQLIPVAFGPTPTSP